MRPRSARLPHTVAKRPANLGFDTFGRWEPHGACSKNPTATAFFMTARQAVPFTPCGRASAGHGLFGKRTLKRGQLGARPVKFARVPDGGNLYRTKRSCVRWL